MLPITKKHRYLISRPKDLTFTILYVPILLLLVSSFIGCASLKRDELTAADWYKKAKDEGTSGQPNWDLVIKWLEKAIEIDPNYAYAYTGLGIAYQEKRLYDKAIASYKKATDLEPDLAEAHYNLGHAFAKTGLKQAAADQLYKAGLLYLEQGNEEGALMAYDCMRQFTPNSELISKLHRKLHPE